MTEMAAFNILKFGSAKWRSQTISPEKTDVLNDAIYSLLGSK